MTLCSGLFPQEDTDPAVVIPVVTGMHMFMIHYLSEQWEAVRQPPRS